MDEPTTDQTNDQPKDESKDRRFTRIGIAGLVIAMVALAAAVMSPWIVDQIEPAPKPIDEVAVDAAVKIKDRLVAKAKGEEYVAPAGDKASGVSWAEVVPASVVGSGALAMCIGIVGFVRQDDVRLSGATVTVGLSAIIFQYFLLIAGALILILLIAIVLGALGIDL